MTRALPLGPQPILASPSPSESRAGRTRPALRRARRGRSGGLHLPTALRRRNGRRLGRTSPKLEGPAQARPRKARPSGVSGRGPGRSRRGRPKRAGEVVAREARFASRRRCRYGPRPARGLYNRRLKADEPFERGDRALRAAHRAAGDRWTRSGEAQGGPRSRRRCRRARKPDPAVSGCGRRRAARHRRPDDSVSLSNLQRQVLFTTETFGTGQGRRGEPTSCAASIRTC